MKDHAIEVHRVRGAFEVEIKRLAALLSLNAAVQDAMRREHAEALAVKDQDLRRAEEPHTALGRRMLKDVDRVG